MENRKPITILSSDWHIDKDNQDEISDIITQIIVLAKELGIKEVIVLGDIFESRKAQPLDNLQFFKSILERFNDAGIVLIAIPGNHDKVNYESELSYLDVFSNHPNFKLITNYESLIRGELLLHFIPFFKENTVYKNYLERIELDSNKKNILLTHVGLDGVPNNSDLYIPSFLKKDMFNRLFKVFIGHYHNRSSYGKNIFYIGSIKPETFGENNDKGFTIIYDNGEHKDIQSKFKCFETIEFDIDNMSKKEIDLLPEKYKDEDKKVRIVLKGSESKLKSVNTKTFNNEGIVIKTVNKELEQGILQSIKGEFINFNKENIIIEFQTFCQIKSLENTDYGKEKLFKILTKEKNG